MKQLRITLDFETRSRANLKAIGAYEYSMDPSTIVTCMGFKTNQTKKDNLFKFAEMQLLFDWQSFFFKEKWKDWVNDPNTVFVAHNAFFEQVIYQNVLVKRFGWPPIKISKWRCTAAKAAAVAIPRNLDGAGRVMELTTQKSYRGHQVMMKLCKPTAAFVKWQNYADKLLRTEGDGPAYEQLLCEQPKEFYDPEDAPEEYEELYSYCRDDVKTEELLDEALPDLTPTEQRLWFYDQKINLRGVAVDIEAVNKISDIMASESKTMGKELDTLTLGLVSSGNARNQILEFLKIEGIELPDLKAKTVDDFLKNGKVTGDAKALLEIRRALSKASTAKYKKFQGCAATDGRARDLFLYHGASTGRWGGKNVQPQNFPRGIIKDIDSAIHYIKTLDLDMLKFLYGNNLMPLFSSVLRGMFIATEGYELFTQDWNAIETRVLWWLADHQEGLDLFRNEVDPYKDLAVDIYKKDIIEIDDDERQVGKAGVLGLGFQMGWRKFITSAWDVYRAKVDEDTAKLAVTIYRKKHFKVTELWTNYNNAAILAIEHPGAKYVVGKVSFHFKDSFLWVTLPSGRPLAYKDPSVVMNTTYSFKYKEDGETKTVYASTRDDVESFVRAGYTPNGSFQSKGVRYWAINHKAKKEDCVIPKWTREATYGGKFTENIVQAVARDLLGEAIVRAEQKGFNVVMHSHDELVSEAPKGKFTSESYQQIMLTLPKWAEGLPLKASGWVADRYKKG